MSILLTNATNRAIKRANYNLSPNSPTFTYFNFATFSVNPSFIAIK